jgi:hypothetical protein
LLAYRVPYYAAFKAGYEALLCAAILSGEQKGKQIEAVHVFDEQFPEIPTSCRLLCFCPYRDLCEAASFFCFLVPCAATWLSELICILFATACQLLKDVLGEYTARSDSYSFLHELQKSVFSLLADDSDSLNVNHQFAAVQFRFDAGT